MVFDLTGAAASHTATGDPAGKIAAPLIISGIVMASWAFCPESRKLRGTSGNPIEQFRLTPPEMRLHLGSGNPFGPKPRPPKLPRWDR